MLVVQEKHCAPELFGLWKIPTGFILEVWFISLKFDFFFFFNLKHLLCETLEHGNKRSYLAFIYVLLDNQSEEIYTGVVREIKEETGVRNHVLYHLT